MPILIGGLGTVIGCLQNYILYNNGLKKSPYTAFLKIQSTRPLQKCVKLND